MSLPSYNDERSTPAPPGCPVWQAGGCMHRIHWVCALLIGAGWGCVLPPHLEQQLDLTLGMWKQVRSFYPRACTA
jgi:hypothetical protein